MLPNVQVVTTTLLAEGVRLPTTRAAAEVVAAPPASPAAPHSSTAMLELLAAHLTHALTENETLPPPGSAAGALKPGTER